MKQIAPARAGRKENRTALTVVLVLCLAMLLPLIVIGFYNRPSADDYSYATLTHQAIENGDGFFGLLKAAWQTDKNFYRSWQGLYSSAFLLALQPGIFGESLYCLTTLVVLLIAWVCLFFGIRILNRHYLHASGFFSSVASVFVLTFLCLWLPSANQGLYWYNGAMNYMLWVFAVFLNLCLSVEIARTPKKCKAVLLLILSTLLSFLISGGNHVTAFSDILFLLFAAVYWFVKERRLFPLFPLAAAGIGFAVMYFAPGTAVRMGVFKQPSVLKTVYFAFCEACYRISGWTSLVFLASLVLLTPVALRIAEQNPPKGKCRFPWIALSASFVILCGMLCVPYYAMGGFGAGRLTNVIWITFVLLGWLNYVLIVRWLKLNRIITLKRTELWKKQSAKIKTILPIGCLLLILLCTQSKTHSSSLRAVRELYNGTAKAYACELDERLAPLHDPALTQVRLKALRHKSKLLFFEDITTGPTDWHNIAISKYYGKSQTVILSDPSGKK